MATQLGIKKRTVVLAQPNYKYGPNAFVPYSAGMLQAYALSIPEIRDNFRFENPLYLREEIGQVVARIEEPSVFGFSCYLWNWEYNNTLAKAIKSRYPNCLIVFGGTHVPAASDGFFENYPHVDVLIHNEGELPFADVLLESLKSDPDFTRVNGVSVQVEGRKTLKTAERERVKDLSILPSPYLAGVFDFMLDEKDLVMNVSFETNRGCPYRCTFCDWGGSVFAKLYAFETDRILDEFKWFAKNRVEYVFCCDANFGIMPRDIELVRQMVEIRDEYEGFPLRFRMCTTKNSGERVFTIVSLLNDAGMNKGATLSFQSMDAHTLEVVDRGNIKLETFNTLMDRYRAANIATYTELIIGMPGETYESTRKGIDTLLDLQPTALNMYAYICTMLPNSEMSAPDYVAKHGIQYVRMPVMLAHSTPDTDIVEYSDIVIGTNSMPSQDWKRTYLFYWAVQAFHCLGLLKQIAIFFHKAGGVKYSDFYEMFIEYFSARPWTTIGREVRAIEQIVEGAMKGGRLDCVLPRFGEIYWPLEEASFLNLVVERDEFYKEVRTFVSELSANETIDPSLLDDLMEYQSALIIDPKRAEKDIILGYDLRGWFERGLSTPPQRSLVRLSVRGDRQYAGNLQDYAYQVAWYNRKGAGPQHHDKDISVHAL